MIAILGWIFLVLIILALFAPATADDAAVVVVRQREPTPAAPLPHMTPRQATHVADVEAKVARGIWVPADQLPPPQYLSPAALERLDTWGLRPVTYHPEPDYCYCFRCRGKRVPDAPVS